MEELIARLVMKTGLSEEVATNAIGIIVRFLAKDGPQDKVDQMLSALPEANAFLEQGGKAGGGMLSGLVGGMGAMSALNQLTSAGLNFDQVQSVAREVVDFARQKAGEETVNDVVRSIPGLNQIV